MGKIKAAYTKALKYIQGLYKCQHCSIFINDNLRLRREKAALRKQLDQALKNDKRDPKTGRYTKG